MNTTNNTKTAFDKTIEALSDETLGHVAGGINPQPLPPNDSKQGPEFKKGPVDIW
jgi:hypothetical protein